MADLTMCATIRCPLQQTCYRFLAIPDKHQSWSFFEVKKGKCKDYIKNERKHGRRK